MAQVRSPAPPRHRWEPLDGIWLRTSSDGSAECGASIKTGFQIRKTASVQRIINSALVEGVGEHDQFVACPSPLSQRSPERRGSPPCAVIFSMWRVVNLPVKPDLSVLWMATLWAHVAPGFVWLSQSNQSVRTSSLAAARRASSATPQEIVSTNGRFL